MKGFVKMLVLCIPIPIYSQNLVTNGSFENYNNCPVGFGQINFADDWFVPTTSSSSDYFNTCCSTGIVGVPSNDIGYQSAFEGDAYAGIIFYCSAGCFGPENYREYIETKMFYPLTAGKKYCVRMSVSLANKSVYAIDEIGIYFSSDSITSPNINYVLPFSPQISSLPDVYLNDTTIWVLLENSFISNGGEEYLTIGNFKDDVSTNFIEVNSNNQVSAAYYYIDDISVVLCESDIKIPNVFTSNNDEWNNQFVVENLPEGATVQIYNRWGALVTEWNTPNGNWDGRMKGGAEASAGVYYCIVKLPNGETKSSFVHLIR